MASSVEQIRPTLPVPRGQQAMLDSRKSTATLSLNDLVEQCYLPLCDNEEFSSLLDAMWNSQAVEGSLAADDYKAAMMIKDYAIENNIAIVKDQNWHTLRKSLNVITRRYNQNRKQRRNRVGGEYVPPAAE